MCTYTIHTHKYLRMHYRLCKQGSYYLLLPHRKLFAETMFRKKITTRRNTKKANQIAAKTNMFARISMETQTYKSNKKENLIFSSINGNNITIIWIFWTVSKSKKEAAVHALLTKVCMQQGIQGHHTYCTQSGYQIDHVKMKYFCCKFPWLKVH